HLLQTGLLDPIQRRSSEYRMGTGGPYFPSPAIHTSLCSLHNGAGRIDHVIQQESALPGDVTDDIHDRRLIRPFTPLVDNGQACLEPLRERTSPLDPPGIWRDHHQVAHLLLGYV